MSAPARHLSPARRPATPPSNHRAPSQREPDDIGDSGLLWLFLSYGYVLYFASNLISEGSQTYCCWCRVSPIVGSRALPVLGSGTRRRDHALLRIGRCRDKRRQPLAVGVYMLAGSTIMLLTVPWALSLWAGRVDLDAEGKANHAGKPKLGANRGPDRMRLSRARRSSLSSTSW